MDGWQNGRMENGIDVLIRDCASKCLDDLLKVQNAFVCVRVCVTVLSLLRLSEALL